MVAEGLETWAGELLIERCEEVACDRSGISGSGLVVSLSFSLCVWSRPGYDSFRLKRDIAFVTSCCGWSVELAALSWPSDAFTVLSWSNTRSFWLIPSRALTGQTYIIHYTSFAQILKVSANWWKTEPVWRFWISMKIT